MRGARFWSALITASLALACKGPPAQVYVIVEADPGVRDQARSLTITITGGERQTDVIATENIIHQQNESLEVRPFPRRFALAPVDGDYRRLYRFLADAHRSLDGADEPFVSTSVISGYQPGETLEIVLRLTDACVNIPCEDPLETCDPATRACIAAFVEPDDLMPARDAGVPDAARPVQCVDAIDCDDGVPCTIERCVSGECARTFDDSICDDAVECTDGRCTPTGCFQETNDADCDDLVPCTTDSCSPVTGCQNEPDDGACTAGPDGECAPDGCQYSTCSLATCMPAAPCFPSAFCDGNHCVRTPRCDPDSAAPLCCGGTCVAPGCNDANGCTNDSCAATGCMNEPRSGTCTDGDPCTQGDFCTSGTCQSGLVGCEDNNECTANSCGPGGCGSEIVSDGTTCNNADPDGCQDRCYSGVCTPGICGCTGSAQCVDSNPCTVNEMCNGGSCTVTTIPGCTTCNNLACPGLCCSGTTCCTSGTTCCGTTCCPAGILCVFGVCTPPSIDGGIRDGGPRDAGPRDAGPRDGGPRDAGPRDGGGSGFDASVTILDSGGPALFDSSVSGALDGFL